VLNLCLVVWLFVCVLVTYSSLHQFTRPYSEICFLREGILFRTSDEISCPQKCINKTCNCSINALKYLTTGAAYCHSLISRYKLYNTGVFNSWFYSDDLKSGGNIRIENREQRPRTILPVPPWLLHHITRTATCCLTTAFSSAFSCKVSFSSENWGEKHCIRIPVAFRLYLVKII
jgi:hypothetical protein